MNLARARWTAVLVMALIGGLFVMPVPAAEKDYTVPADAKGFAGTIEGKAISKNDTTGALVIKIQKVVSTRKDNLAKKPAALKGATVEILPQVLFAGGRLTADSKQIDFVKSLAIGSSITATLKSDGLFKLRMQNTPAVMAEKRSS